MLTWNKDHPLLSFLLLTSPLFSPSRRPPPPALLCMQLIAAGPPTALLGSESVVCHALQMKGE